MWKLWVLLLHPSWCVSWVKGLILVWMMIGYNYEEYETWPTTDTAGVSLVNLNVQYHTVPQLTPRCVQVTCKHPDCFTCRLFDSMNRSQISSAQQGSPALRWTCAHCGRCWCRSALSDRTLKTQLQVPASTHSDLLQPAAVNLVVERWSRWRGACNRWWDAVWRCILCVQTVQQWPSTGAPCSTSGWPLFCNIHIFAVLQTLQRWWNISCCWTFTLKAFYFVWLTQVFIVSSFKPQLKTCSSPSDRFTDLLWRTHVASSSADRCSFSQTTWPTAFPLLLAWSFSSRHSALRSHRDTMTTWGVAFVAVLSKYTTLKTSAELLLLRKRLEAKLAATSKNTSFYSLIQTVHRPGAIAVKTRTASWTSGPRESR